MDHEAHIRLVDPHAERDRGAHDEALFQQESPLALGANLRIKTGMIGERGNARPLQRLGHVLRALARGGVDDARETAARLDQLHHARRAAATLGLRRERQVRAVKARHMEGRIG